MHQLQVVAFSTFWITELSPADLLCAVTKILVVPEYGMGRRGSEEPTREDVNRRQMTQVSTDVMITFISR